MFYIKHLTHAHSFASSSASHTFRMAAALRLWLLEDMCVSASLHILTNSCDSFITPMGNGGTPETVCRSCYPAWLQIECFCTRRNFFVPNSSLCSSIQNATKYRTRPFLGKPFGLAELNDAKYFEMLLKSESCVLFCPTLFF